MNYIQNKKGRRTQKSVPFFYSVKLLCLQTIVFVTCMLFFLSVTYADPEIHGLWVVRDAITSSEQVQILIDFADLHHYNVIFVQVRGRGDAYYKSYFVPPPKDYPNIPYVFDPLEEIIKLAHLRGIEVHAWFNMYLTWSSPMPPIDPEHPLNKHPEWFMVSIDGHSMADTYVDSIKANFHGMRYLSPGLESVRNYLSRVVTEVIVSYNVDGVHLDYIRYPGREYDFHAVVRNEFSDLYDVDPIKVVSPLLSFLPKHKLNPCRTISPDFFYRNISLPHRPGSRC